MDVGEVLRAAAVFMIVFGFVLTVLGVVPATRSRLGDTLGWGVSLLVLGVVMLLLVFVMVG